MEYPLQILLVPVIILLMMACPCSADVEDLYCGTDNCYDLLGVSDVATKLELTRAYRKLAKKWHPDVHKKKADKESAAVMFQKIANAYEILKDEESRTDYDYMLEHPEEYYSHYYRYYRRRVAPKVDVRIVIAVTITIISVIQYWSAWNNYNTAISYLITVPKYRLQAQEIARNEGLIGDKKKKDRTKTKDELKEEEENILKNVLQNKMDIRGSYGKPTVYDILWLQLLLSPVYIVKYVIWYVKWIWKFTICGNEYGDEEKKYIIRRNMKLSQGRWEALELFERDEFFRAELWITEKFKAWKLQKEEDAKAELSQNSRYKSYRRYMKKGGPGQMSFGPE